MSASRSEFFEGLSDVESTGGYEVRHRGCDAELNFAMLAKSGKLAS